jgi:hypothetical protein
LSFNENYPDNLGSRKDAILKTKKKPHLSVMVVKSGPEASAGSVLRLFKISGIGTTQVTAKP